MKEIENWGNVTQNNDRNLFQIECHCYHGINISGPDSMPSYTHFREHLQALPSAKRCPSQDHITPKNLPQTSGM